MWATAIRESQLPAEPELERLERVFLPWGAAKKDHENRRSAGEDPRRDRGRLRRAAPELYVRRGAPRRRELCGRGEGRTLERYSRRAGYGQDHRRDRRPRAGRCRRRGAHRGRSARGDVPHGRNAVPLHRGARAVSRGEKLRVSGIELDEARRRLLYKLSEERAKLPDRKEGDFPETPRIAPAPHLPAINFSFQTAAQMTPELAALCPECVYVPLELLARLRRSPMRSAKTARRSSPRSPPLRSAKRKRASCARLLQRCMRAALTGAHRKSRSRDDGGTGGFPHPRRL